MSKLVVASLSGKSIQNKALVMTKTFYVADADADMAPVTGKTHSSAADANAELSSMKGLAEGLSFAEAQYPDLAERGRKSKANVIAEYLSWDAAGRPVKEVAEPEDAPLIDAADEEEEEVDFD